MGVFHCIKCRRYWSTKCRCVGVYSVDVCHGCTASIYRRQAARGRPRHVRKFLLSPREHITLLEQDPENDFLKSTDNLARISPVLRMMKSFDGFTKKTEDAAAALAQALNKAKADSLATITKPRTPHEFALMEALGKVGEAAHTLLAINMEGIALMKEMCATYSESPKCSEVASDA